MKFLREKLGFTIAYFCGTGLVMLFYYLSYNKSSELAYPLALVLFVYIIYMIIEFIRFKKFLSALRYM